jgi:acetyl-CoA carboxylase biotin carboxyl carrier protein
MTSPDGKPTLDALVQAVADIARSTSSMPRRVSVALGDARIDVDWPAEGTLGDSAATQQPQHPLAEDYAHHVTAPLVGTFYRAPEPGAAPFVEIGDMVQPGQQVGIVEAMKLTNSILSEMSGRVVQVLAENGEFVEYGQPLVALEPVEAR